MRPEDENIKIQAFLMNNTGYNMISNHDIPYNLIDPQTGGFPRSLWLPYEVTESGSLFRNAAGAQHWVNAAADLANKAKSNHQPPQPGYVFELQTYHEVAEDTANGVLASHISKIGSRPELDQAYHDVVQDTLREGPTYSEKSVTSQAIFSTPPEPPPSLAPQPRNSRYNDEANDRAAEGNQDIRNYSRDELVRYCQKLEASCASDRQSLAMREMENKQLMARTVELEQTLNHSREKSTKPNAVARPVSVPVVKLDHVANLEAQCKLYEQETFQLAETVKQKETELQAVNQRTQQEQQNFAQKLADKEQEMLFLEQTFSDYRRETEALRRIPSEVENTLRMELETHKKLLQQMEKSQEDVAHRSILIKELFLEYRDGESAQYAMRMKEVEEKEKAQKEMMAFQHEELQRLKMKTDSKKNNEPVAQNQNDALAVA